MTRVERGMERAESEELGVKRLAGNLENGEEEQGNGEGR